MRRIRSVLEERDFRVLLTGQFVAQAADGMAQAVFADRLILEPVSAGTPERILALFAITLVPYSGLAPFLGVFVDRWPRRALMAWANALRALILITLPMWAPRLPSDSGLFVGVIALLGLGRLFLTTKGASLPTVLHERFLLRGNAISSGGGMISALFGGVVGLAAIGVIGGNEAFVLAGLAYALAAFALTRLSRSMAHPHPDPGPFAAEVAAIARELAQGLLEFARRARARLPIIGVFIVRSVGMLTTIAAILVIKDLYETDSTRRWISAVALGAAGAGAFIGASVAPLLGRKLPKAGLIITGFCASGLGIVALGGIEN
ncbi:MAG: MFS transporter, partial [Actinomycetota bacterium]|nr:MFS transporter [Actinomycetota bacterium]